MGPSGKGIRTTDETRLAKSWQFFYYVVLVLILTVINMSCMVGVHYTLLSTFVYVWNFP